MIQLDSRTSTSTEVGIARSIASVSGECAEAQATISRSSASRTGMKELTVRALIYKAHLGEPGVEETARLLAADIDNPRLTALVYG